MHSTISETTARRIIITGASSGIGAALAVQLSARGDRVMLVARREAALQEVVRACGTSSSYVVADVTQRVEVRRVIAEAIAREGHVDVLVNNVGRGITRPVSQLTDDDVEQMMRVNVLSALYGMQEILPHFVERGEGHVVNVSSMLGRVPSAPFRSAYSGAKHFLNAITANFRDELRDAHPDIAVSLVSPPMVATEFGINAVHGGPDSRRFASAQPVDEVAAVIARVIDTREPDVYTRAGLHAQVADYFSETGRDPA